VIVDMETVRAVQYPEALRSRSLFIERMVADHAQLGCEIRHLQRRQRYEWEVSLSALIDRLSG
jgi:hypothetical protein